MKATIDKFGTKYYRLDNKFHREDGPAIEWADGAKAWYLNGKLHREDGPAYEGSYGIKEWWLNGKRISCEDNEKFLRIIKLMVFL